MMTLCGLDIGGTTTRVAIVSGGTTTTRRFATEVAGPEHLVGHVIDVIDRTCTDAETSAATIQAVGVGVPGTVDSDHGTVRLASNLGVGESPVSMGAMLSEQLGAPVTVENDVKTAAIGLVGMLPDPQQGILTYVSVGTGISSATVIDGELLRGSHGSAGEIGQMRVVADGPDLDGAIPGSLESLASGRAIDDSGPTSDARLREAISHLAVGVHALWMAFDPHAMVIGGGATKKPGFEIALNSELDKLRSASSVTRSIVNLDNLTVLDPDATPGVDGALHLASQIPRESGGATRPATTGGNTI